MGWFSKTVCFGIVIGVAQGVAGSVFQWAPAEQVAVWGFVTLTFGAGHHIGLTANAPASSGEGQ